MASQLHTGASELPPPSLALSLLQPCRKGWKFGLDRAAGAARVRFWDAEHTKVREPPVSCICCLQRAKGAAFP